MYHIGICDDEPIFLQHITKLTKDIMEANNIPCKITAFKDGKQLRSYLQNFSLDLLILDILLKDDNGMQLAKWLRQTENLLPIIFITSSMDYILDGYTVEPLGYLLKPVEYEKLEEALLRACKRVQNNKLVLTTPSQTVSLSLNDILYLEINNKTLAIHTLGGNTQEIALPLHVLADKLPAEHFVKCHRSYIVSLPSIISVRRYVIELKNHEKIPVSKTCYQNVQNALLSWVSKLN